MIFVFLGAAVGLSCYLLGFFTGKRYADQKIEEMRLEMGLEENRDLWVELFKEDND